MLAGNSSLELELTSEHDVQATFAPILLYEILSKKKQKLNIPGTSFEQKFSVPLLSLLNPEFRALLEDARAF